MSLMADFEYKGDQAKTDDNRIDGFFTVGDLGELDEDGYLYLRDRKSDMIISGGVNIYPAEIEGELITHPKVADVAVFGIPHAGLGRGGQGRGGDARRRRGLTRGGGRDPGVGRHPDGASSSCPAPSTSSRPSPASPTASSSSAASATPTGPTAGSQI